MIDLRFVFMERPPAAGTRVSQFRATYVQTLDLLEEELKKLGARSVTIQAGFQTEDIRNDGWPKGRARASHPACALEFQDRTGQQLVFRAVKFTTFDANLRAIALTLEALRAVDRYGVVEGEQYAGFKQLAAAPAKMTREEAAQWLIEKAYPYTTINGCAWTPNGVVVISPTDVIFGTEAQRQSLYRMAANFLHPDKPGGSHEQFTQLQEVMDILKGGE